jgi:hypothetical protein
VIEENDSMRRWQAKICRLRQHLRGWPKNISGANRMGLIIFVEMQS